MTNNPQDHLSVKFSDEQSGKQSGKMSDDRAYPSKILLFGEYSIIQGSLGIAVPYHRYSGQWKFKNAGNTDSDLSGLASFIRGKNILSAEAIRRFQEDIDEGLIFDSNIPQGMGLGSSGAVCAGVLDRYFEKVTQQDLADLEGYFHSTSSGIDPFISYEQAPYLFRGRAPIEKLDISKDFVSKYASAPGRFQLINTQIKRKTAPFVRLFQNKLESRTFERSFDLYSECVDRACLAFVQNNFDKLDHEIHQISKWQVENLPEFFTPEVTSKAKEGLDSGHFFIKLCGAGGGGRYLMWDRANLELGQEVIAFELSKSELE